MADEAADLALALVRSRRTIVLATAGAGAWAAPVYYVYDDGRFCFFSSERSRHVVDALATGRCAAAVFRDGDDWRDIEGLQMDGRLVRVEEGPGATGIFAQYVARFPTVRGFFDDEFDLERFEERFRARLYAFVPTRAFYLNNRAGFGTRREIRLPV